MEITIRQEKAGDETQIRNVIISAFIREEEARLVENLRRRPEWKAAISLVAVLEKDIAGHILFFPVKIKQSSGEEKQSLCLAPVSVRCDLQGKGIGSALIEEGISDARRLEYESINVVGSEKYYPRFGFLPAINFGIKCSIAGVPEKNFMVLELEKGSLAAGGVVVYPPEFNEV